MKIKTIDQDLERKYLHQDLLKEADSDEDGGEKTRVEFDSDFSLSEEEENYKPEPEPDGENWSKILTQQRQKNNTGVKGVRADYEEAKQIVRRRNETKRMQDEEALLRSAYGATFSGESASLASQLKGEYIKKYDADEEDNSEEDSDDDEFLAQYRAQRFQQMRGFSQLPQHGKVKYVEKFEFLDEIDNADPRTFVVTHIYEEYIAACRRMNAVLDQFAAKHPYVKVLKLVATEASQTLSHRALPAFLVYKNKEMVSDSSVGVNEHEFGTGTFGLPEVEWFLATRYGMELMGVDIAESEKGTAAQAVNTAELDKSSWAPSHQPSIGSVNLLSSRMSKSLKLAASKDDDDDDDW